MASIGIPLRVGVIGCSHYGATHLDCWAALPDEARIVAVCDVDSTRMERHAALAGLAAARGFGVIVQKPMAPSLAEAHAVARTAHEAGTWLAVHENFRFRETICRARDTLASGAIGSPNWARIASRTGSTSIARSPISRASRASRCSTWGRMCSISRAFSWATTSACIARRSAATGASPARTR